MPIMMGNTGAYLAAPLAPSGGAYLTAPQVNYGVSDAPVPAASQAGYVPPGVPVSNLFPTPSDAPIDQSLFNFDPNQQGQLLPGGPFTALSAASSGNPYVSSAPVPAPAETTSTLPPMPVGGGGGIPTWNPATWHPESANAAARDAVGIPRDLRQLPIDINLIQNMSPGEFYEYVRGLQSNIDPKRQAYLDKMRDQYKSDGSTTWGSHFAQLQRDYSGQPFGFADRFNSGQWAPEGQAGWDFDVSPLSMDVLNQRIPAFEDRHTPEYLAQVAAEKKQMGGLGGLGGINEYDVDQGNFDDGTNIGGSFSQINSPIYRPGGEPITTMVYGRDENDDGFSYTRGNNWAQNNPFKARF